VSLRRRTGSQSRLRRELVNSSTKLWSMSVLGQKQTCAVQTDMSALPPIADMCGAARDVRYGPIADICQTISLLPGRLRLCLRNDLSDLSIEFVHDQNFDLSFWHTRSLRAAQSSGSARTASHRA